jgi:hypothetical protein
MKGYVVATAVFRSTDPGSNDLGFKDLGYVGKGKAKAFLFVLNRSEIIRSEIIGFSKPEQWVLTNSTALIRPLFRIFPL